MKKRIILLVVLLVGVFLCLSAHAETSANLHLKTEYNAKRKVTRRYYVNDAGALALADDLGFAEIRYTYDARWHVIRTVYYDADGGITNGPQGYATAFTLYTPGGKIRSQEYTDADGHLVIGPDGFARLENSYIDSKLLTGTKRFGTDGALLQSDSDWALYRIDYKRMNTGKHLKVRETYMDAEGQPIDGSDGWAWADYEYVADKVSRTAFFHADGSAAASRKNKWSVCEKVYQNGRFRSMTYYDEEGRPAWGPDGYATVEYGYTNAGARVTSERYYDPEGAPCQVKGGYYGIGWGFDPKGRKNRYEYFDADGKLTLNADGYASKFISFLTYGKAFKTVYRDLNGQVAIAEALGYAVEEDYYQRGLLISTTYLDADGQPIDSSAGYAKVVYTYASRKVSGERYYHANGEPAVNKDGCSAVLYENDDAGRHLSLIRLNEAGGRILQDGLYDEVRYEWDEETGYKLAESYWLNGEAATAANGAHSTGFTYTVAGKVAAQNWYDLNDEPVMIDKGYARQVTVYDPSGKKSGDIYYDTKGQIIDRGKEYAYSLQTWSRDQRTSTTVYYGIDGKPMNLKAGHACWIQVTDAQNRVIEEVFNRADGTAGIGRLGAHRIKRVLDKAGNPVEEAYFNRNDEPAPNDRGYALIRRAYDGKKHVIREAWFGTEGQPVTTGNTYVACERDYDDAGNVIEERYYDARNALVPNKKGYAIVRKSYDEKKHIIREAWFDANDQPVTAGNTYVAYERDYDEAGNAIEERYYDAENHLVLNNEGYAIIRWSPTHPPV